MLIPHHEPADLSHWPRDRPPRLLDLFCCEGGASAGYVAAGFEVVGVDSKPQPRYPFEFIHADVLDLSVEFLRGFDAVAASPPCKTHTSLKAFSAASHVDLIPQTRRLLAAAGRPFIIENVEGAPLIDPVLLCGSMFGLNVRRHRLFEANWPMQGPRCDHARQNRESPGFTIKRYHSGEPVEHQVSVITIVGRGAGMGPGEIGLWRDAMEMPWASKDGLREAIPPPFTKWIGEQLLALVGGDA